MTMQSKRPTTIFNAPLLAVILLCASGIFISTLLTFILQYYLSDYTIPDYWNIFNFGHTPIKPISIDRDKTLSDQYIQLIQQIPQLTSVFNYKLYSRVNNSKHFLQRIQKLPSRDKYIPKNPKFEAFLQSIDPNKPDYKKQARTRIKYTVKQPKIRLDYNQSSYNINISKSSNYSYSYSYSSNFNYFYNFFNDSNNNDYDYEYKTLTFRKADYNHMRPFISSHWPLLFMPIFKNGLTKIGPLLLLLFENAKWIPQAHTKRHIAIPGNDPSNDLFVHQYFGKKMHSIKNSKNFSEYHSIMTNNKLIKFIVIRDPLQRLLSGFLEKCIVDPRHWCSVDSDKINFVFNRIKNQTQYNLTNIDIENIKIELFQQFVENLNTRLEKSSGINEHFAPQSSFAMLYHFIDYFDYIIILDKDDFGQNVYSLMNLFVKKEKIIGLNQTTSVDYYMNHWGLTKNDSLFKRFTTHSISTSNQQELQLLKKYYFSNFNTLNTAFKMYQFDYMLFPLEYPPRWLKSLFHQT